MDLSFLSGEGGVQLPDPMAQAAKGITLADMMTRSQIAQHTLLQQQRADAASNALNAVLPEVHAAGYSPEAINAAIQKAPQSAGLLLDALDKKRKSEADYRKTIAGAQKDETEAKMKVAGSLGNEAMWLAEHPNLSPEMVGNFMKKVAANGLQDIITPLPFQQWSDPQAARQNLASAGNAFYEVKDRITAAEVKRNHLATEAMTAAENQSQAQRRLAETAIGWGHVNVARDRLAYDKDAGKRPSVQADADGNLWAVNPVTGMAKAITLEDGTALNRGSKAPTEAQANAILFGTRAVDSDKALLAMQEGGFDPTTKQFGRDMVVSGRLLTNWMASEQGQQYINVGKNFVAAALRRESGAAINEGEWKMGQMLYIPMPGDKPAQLAAKARNRQLVIEGIRASVGDRMAANIDKALASVGGDPVAGPRSSSGAIRVPGAKVPIQGLGGITITPE